jgi:hypothetical protein
VVEDSNRLTRFDRRFFKLLGLSVIVIGLATLGVGTWVSLEEWIAVAKWPRTQAVLVREESLKTGARLTFRFKLGQQPITGIEYRWGGEEAIKKLQSYTPGTTYTIRYDPDGPDVSTILTYTWELFSAPITIISVALFLVIGGIVVRRWSNEPD